jgi:hypothetical protein
MYHKIGHKYVVCSSIYMQVRSIKWTVVTQKCNGTDSTNNPVMGITWTLIFRFNNAAGEDTLDIRNFPVSFVCIYQSWQRTCDLHNTIKLLLLTAWSGEVPKGRRVHSAIIICLKPHNSIYIVFPVPLLTIIILSAHIWVVKALCCKPKGRGFKSRWGGFFKLT